MSDEWSVTVVRALTMVRAVVTVVRVPVRTRTTVISTHS